MSLEENKRLGYISLFRSMLDWEWFTDVNTTHLFIYCLLSANHKDKRYRGDLVKRGSFLTSLDILSKKTGLTVSQVRTSLNHLESTHEVTSSKSAKGTVISIENYDLYQHNDTLNDKPVTSHRQTNDKPVTTNNNDNNDNNVVVSDDTTNATTPFQFDDDFEKFWKAYRKKSNKRDTYEVWKNDVDKDDIELIVFAAKEYSKENENDRKAMMYSRTFLENECYLDYSKKFEKHKAFLREQEENKKLMEQAKNGDYWND